MRETPPIILGVSPGTRIMGIVVLEGKELTDWRIKTYRGKWSKKKLSAILQTLLTFSSAHQIAYIAIKAPHASRSSQAGEECLNEIRILAKQRKIAVREFSMPDIKKQFPGAKNARALGEHIGNRYPELLYEYKKELSNRHQYYNKLFEAIATALLIA